VGIITYRKRRLSTVRLVQIVGIAQLLELGIESLIESGRLEVVFPDWLGERFPHYALHPSRNYLPLEDTGISRLRHPNSKVAHLNCELTLHAYFKKLVV
jgi:hypothetical protein